jgi:hypothetical protein
MGDLHDKFVSCGGHRRCSQYACTASPASSYAFAAAENWRAASPTVMDEDFDRDEAFASRCRLFNANRRRAVYILAACARSMMTLAGPQYDTVLPVRRQLNSRLCGCCGFSGAIGSSSICRNRK